MYKDYKSFPALKRLLTYGGTNIGDLIILLKNLQHEGYDTISLELGMKYEDFEDQPSPCITEVGASGFYQKKKPRNRKNVK